MTPLPKPRKSNDFSDIIASYSSFLVGIMRRMPEVLAEILSQDGKVLFEKYLHEDISLRLFRQKVALLTAINDLKGTWSLVDITDTLTKAADFAVQTALKEAFPDSYNGLFVIAMGKMGANELNYSSDIDLILFFDAEKCTIQDNVLKTFEKAAQYFVKILSERTGEGYVHRVDLRLRPDPGSTPIVISTQQALDYYATRGQTWERSAYIKARIVAGDLKAGEKFLQDLSPFIWRKYLDLSSLTEIHEMKEAINAYKGHETIAVAGHNIKLGRGGIREIEFFAQAQQLLSGGRNPALRHIRTLETLDILNAKHLREPYIFLRNIEHRLQMMNDEQTHTLPDDLTDFARFAGYKSISAFEKAVLKQLKIVETAYKSLFVKPETLDIPLSFHGFKDAKEIVASWKKGIKSTRLKEELETLLPSLLNHFRHEGDANNAFLAFDRLITKAKHPLDLIALLKSDTSLPQVFAKILSAAPRLTTQIMRRAHVLGGLFEPAFYQKTLDEMALQAKLHASLSLANSSEETLDRMRIFTQEQQFLTSLKLISRQMPLEKAGEAYSALADTLIKACHELTQKTLHLAHGNIENEKTAILAMGKCGAREMNAASDLDLIMLYEGVGMSNGEKPLAHSHYFTKYTQKLITNLTVQTGEGGLYAVDFRLRPSGNKGPIATSLASFLDYQMSEAWTWEHMALTKARVVSGEPDFVRDIHKTIHKILTKKRDATKIKHDIVEMRQLIADDKGDDNLWDLKNAAGGLTDIEFIAQSLQLIHAHKHPDILQKSTKLVLEKAMRYGLIDAEILLKSLKLQQSLMQLLRLATDDAEMPYGLQKLIAITAEQPDFHRAELHLKELQCKTRMIFTAYFAM
jgi:[glutamine synthetase] adenylyltransferase / [glutamine synthetase]-adenylyl-L-tyrosine phosphorylase